MSDESKTNFWNRLQYKYLDNIRLGALPEEIQARFFKLYILAGKSDPTHGKSPDSGVIKFSNEEIAWSLHITLDELKRTYALLEPTGLFANNGRGPEITLYAEDQKPPDPHSARQKKYIESKCNNSDTVNDSVSDTVNDEQSLESESELKIESKSEYEDSQSSGLSADQTDDDISLTKKELLSLCGIPGQFRASILNNNQISKAVILAELARNYARKGPGKEQVRQPGFITGLNLSKNELPDDEWFNQDRWISHLPSAMRTALGLAPSETQDQDDNNDKSSGYTQGENEPEQVSANVPEEMHTAWDAIKKQIRSEIPKASFTTFVSNTNVSGVGVAEDLVQVQVSNSAQRDWLEEHLTATVQRLLGEITGGREWNIQFVTGGA